MGVGFQVMDWILTCEMYPCDPPITADMKAPLEGKDSRIKKNLKEQQDFSREKKNLFFDGRANGEEHRSPDIHFLVIIGNGSHCKLLNL